MPSMNLKKSLLLGLLCSRVVTINGVADSLSVTVGHGSSFLGNPFNNGNNAADVIFPNPDPSQSFSGPYDGDAIAIWVCGNPGHYVVSYFDSTITETTTGFTDEFGKEVPAPI